VPGRRNCSISRRGPGVRPPLWPPSDPAPDRSGARWVFALSVSRSGAGSPESSQATNLATWPPSDLAPDRSGARAAAGHLAPGARCSCSFGARARSCQSCCVQAELLASAEASQQPSQSPPGRNGLLPAGDGLESRPERSVQSRKERSSQAECACVQVAFRDRGPSVSVWSFVVILERSPAVVSGTVGSCAPARDEGTASAARSVAQVRVNLRDRAPARGRFPGELAGLSKSSPGNRSLAGALSRRFT